MAIIISVSNNFLSTFVDSIDVFDYRLPSVNKKPLCLSKTQANLYFNSVKSADSEALQVS